MNVGTNAPRTTVLVILSVTVLVPPALPASRTRTIHVGETQRLELPTATHRLALVLDVDRSVPIALEARSLDLDVALEVWLSRKAEGAPWVQDEDGNEASDSRVVLPPRDRTRVRVEVVNRDPECAGVVEVLATVSPTETSSPDRREATKSYWNAVRARAHERGCAPREIRALVELSEVARGEENLAESEARLVEARALAESAWGPTDPRRVALLRSSAEQARLTGSLEAATALSEAALSLAESANGREHPVTARCLLTRGRVLVEAGSSGEARPLFERALGIFERERPGGFDVCVTLADLSGAVANLGDFEPARRMSEQAVSLLEGLVGPESVELARALSNLGTILQEQGDFVEEKRVLERAVAILERSGGNPLSLAGALNNLAGAHVQLGSLAEAKSGLERALVLFEEVLGPEHMNLAILHTNLGELSRALGDTAGARAHLERALAIEEEIVGTEHPLYAATLNNLGGVVFEAGDANAARPLFERALAIRERVLGSEHPDVAANLQGLGGILVATGHPGEAKPILERAAAMFAKLVGEDSSSVAYTVRLLSRALWDLGDADGAIRETLHAEAIGRDHLRLMARGLAEEQALEYAAVRPNGLSFALRLGEKGLSEPARAAVWDALVRSRALVQDEMATRRLTASGSRDPEIARLGEAATQATRRLASLILGESGAAGESARAVVQEARAEKRRAEAEFALRSAPFRTKLASENWGSAEVRTALPSGSALVSYVRYGQQEFRSALEASPDAYAALVLRPGRETPELLMLGKAEEIDGLVADWRREVLRGAGATGEEARSALAAYRAAAEALRKRVWDPVASRIPAARRVFVVPDGTLHLVSFASLPTPHGGYLAEEGPVLHSLATERDLVGASKEPSPGQGVLVVAGPDFDARGVERPEAAAAVVFRGGLSSCGNFASHRFDALPGTLREGEVVVSEYAAFAADGTGEPVTRLFGAEATEAAFKSQAPGKRAIHLATHGFFLGAGCSATGGARGVAGLTGSGESRSEGGEPVAKDAASTPKENPLLRSGLALGGANRRDAARPDQDDGILTAEEIAALDLSGVEWAVLSACDTGVGEIAAGEGVLGLRRAFQVAGARTLILSLWSVEDDSARAWMEALYAARLRRRLDTADSVRAASLAVLRERRAKHQSTHPFYWAGFVAAGDWR